MPGGACWSSVVATPRERAALHLTSGHDWLVACVLPADHAGAHASDGAQRRRGRRRWLLWGDYARGAQNLADEPACPAQALDGAPCLFFAGHGGVHRYAAPLGEDFPSAPAPASPRAPAPASTPAPVSMPVPNGSRPRSSTPQAAPPASRSGSAAVNHSLDDLFASMPSLADLPRTDPVTFPDGAFDAPRPPWPASHGTYVAQHRLDGPVEPEPVVSRADDFRPAAHAADAAPHGVARDESPWMQVRPGKESTLTTPMVEVISSSADPVRMGVPSARQRLPESVDIASITSVVEDAAARLRMLPELREHGDLADALQDVAASLSRLAVVLKRD